MTETKEGHHVDPKPERAIGVYTRPTTDHRSGMCRGLEGEITFDSRAEAAKQALNAFLEEKQVRLSEILRPIDRGGLDCTIVITGVEIHREPGSCRPLSLISWVSSGPVVQTHLVLD